MVNGSVNGHQPLKPGTALLTLDYRMCNCGCGQTPPLARYTDRARGRFKGCPIRQVPGHQGRHQRPQWPGNPNPSGLCQCGCGQRTTIAPQTVTKYDQVRGKPKRFVIGHQLRTPYYRRRATKGRWTKFYWIRHYLAALTLPMLSTRPSRLAIEPRPLRDRPQPRRMCTNCFQFRPVIAFIDADICIVCLAQRAKATPVHEQMYERTHKMRRNRAAGARRAKETILKRNPRP